MSAERTCPVTGYPTLAQATRGCARCEDVSRPACRVCQIKLACRGYRWWHCRTCGGWHLEVRPEVSDGG